MKSVVCKTSEKSKCLMLMKQFFLCFLSISDMSVFFLTEDKLLFLQVYESTSTMRNTLVALQYATVFMSSNPTFPLLKPMPIPQLMISANRLPIRHQCSFFQI